MTSASSHYKIINFSIVMLAVFVLALTGEMAREAYTDYRAVRDMNQANTMADRLIDAAGIVAAERGLTNSALGSTVRITPANLKNIIDLREKGDASWKKALALARDLASRGAQDSEFIDAIRLTDLGARARDQGVVAGAAAAPNERTFMRSACTTAGLDSRSGFGGMRGDLPPAAPPLRMAVSISESGTVACQAASV